MRTSGCCESLVCGKTEELTAAIRTPVPCGWVELGAGESSPRRLVSAGKCRLGDIPNGLVIDSTNVIVRVSTVNRLPNKRF